MRPVRSTAYAVSVLSLAAMPFASSASAATPVAPGAIPADLTKVNLLTINDFHGHIDDNGLALACVVEQRRAALGDSNTILVSNGDNIGASPFVSASAFDIPTMKYLNTIGVKASSVGNHEFDKGYGDIVTRVAANETFPTLGANVYKKGTTTPALPEYSIQTVNGVRVAYIGAVTGETPNIVMPDGIKDVSFGDPVEAVNRVAAKLKAAGAADVFVAAYHEGAGISQSAGDLAAAQASRPAFNDIVTKTSADIDVILNAHTHQTYTYDAPTASGTRPVLQASSYGKMLGEVQLGLDPTTKKVVAYAQQTLATKGTDLSKCAGNTTVDAAGKIIDAAKADAAKTGNVVVAQQVGDIMRGDGESPLANLDAQAWLDQMNAAGRPGADIGIMNPGGVRADLPYASNGSDKDGEITFAEAFAVNPFGNTMQVITITGAQLRTLLEQQWTGKPADQVKPLLGLSNNVHYTYDASKPEGQRIVSVTVNGKEVQATDSFRVTSGSFLIGGGDGYTVLKEGTNKIDTGLNDADEFVAWLKKNSPVKADLSKRGEVAKPGETTEPTKPGDVTPTPGETSEPTKPGDETTKPSDTPSAPATPAQPTGEAPKPGDTAQPSDGKGPRVETDMIGENAGAFGLAGAAAAALTGAAAIIWRRKNA